ncbi:MAG: hypothetical protein AB7W59_17985, partial [Acidimicrobiia bacterium]
SALALCRAGTTMARSAGSVFDEAQSLLMAAVLAATLERPDAVDDCAEALAFVRRTGYGVFLGSLLGAVATVLADLGGLDAAATVAGHCAAHHPLDAAGVFGGFGQLPAALHGHPAAAALAAVGAAMERSAVLDVALDAVHAVQARQLATDESGVAR